MADRKVQFAEDHFYHIYNRGIDKRQIFLDDFDYVRFLESLRDFNEIEITGGIYLKKIREKKFGRFAPKYFGSESPKTSKRPLVRICCYCLMPNHFHLLLEQLANNGISEFMRRIGTGYANYFNLKYERTGRLFEGPFRAVLMEHDNQFRHILRYIHLNPLDLLKADWRENGMKDWEKARKFLDNYYWSSHRVYLQGLESQIIDRGIFSEIFPNRDDYENFLKDWVVKDLADLSHLILE